MIANMITEDSKVEDDVRMARPGTTARSPHQDSSGTLMDYLLFEDSDGTESPRESSTGHVVTQNLRNHQKLQLEKTIFSTLLSSMNEQMATAPLKIKSRKLKNIYQREAERKLRTRARMVCLRLFPRTTPLEERSAEGDSSRSRAKIIDQIIWSSLSQHRCKMTWQIANQFEKQIRL